MAFADITALATDAAKEEQLRRKQQLDLLDQKEHDAKVADERGIIGMSHDPRITFSPGAVKELGQEQVFSDHRTRRYDQQRNELIANAPTPDSMLDQWLPPGAREAVSETPQMRKDELDVDPRGRAARLDALKDEIIGHPGGGASAGPQRAFSVGTGAHDEPYFTNLSRDELHSEHHDANAIRHAAGLGSEPPPVTDLHPLQLGGGGTFSNIGGRVGEKLAPEGRAKDMLLRSLDIESRAAREAPLTDKEMAGAMLEHEPKWDQTLAQTGYGEGVQSIRKAVAGGELPPEVGQALFKKYSAIHNEAVKANIADDYQDPDTYFKQYLNAKRLPDPNVVAASQQMPAAGDIAKQHLDEATQAHGDAAVQGPGTSISPVRQALATGARYGVPIAADLAAGALGATGLGLAPAMGLAAAGGAGGEALADLLETGSVDPTATAGAGVLNAAGGAIGRGLGRLGTRFAQGLKGASAFGEASTNAASRVAQGMGKEAIPGVGGGRASRAAAAAATQGAEPASGPIAFLKERLPALRGGGFEMGAESATESAGRPAPRVAGLLGQSGVPAPADDILSHLLDAGAQEDPVALERIRQFLRERLRR